MKMTEAYVGTEVGETPVKVAPYTDMVQSACFHLLS